jgi:hypothetical protein
MTTRSRSHEDGETPSGGHKNANVRYEKINDITLELMAEAAGTRG